MPNGSSVPRYYFPPSRENSGPILRVTAANGNEALVIISGEIGDFRVVTWPATGRFLALPSAWLVSADAPRQSEQLRGFEGHTVHYVFPLPGRGLVLVGHCCGIYFYDKDGMRWGHDDLFCCADPVLDVVGDALLLRAHKHGEDPGETPVLKQLNLLSGRRA
ncbi:MAG TPA: hypothetical protein VF741_07615 [Candidatus Aquilonibacter sp.]